MTEPDQHPDKSDHHQSSERSHKRSGAKSSGGSHETAEEMVVYHAGIIAIVGLIATYKIISTGHLSARIFKGEAPSYEIGEIPGILWRFTHNPFDPNEAWEPVNTGGEVASALPFYTTMVITLILHVALLGGPLYKLYKAWKGRGKGDIGWAEGKDVHDLLLKTDEEPSEHGRMVVGRYHHRNVAIDRLHSLLVVGPLRSGKTNAISVPTLLEWDGPALVVSVKGHLMDQTLGWRAQKGQVRVFDPAAASRYERSGWVILDECSDWEGAIGMAQHLQSAAYGSLGGRIEGGDPSQIEAGALWATSMSMVLAPFLYAGSVKGTTIVEVAQWIVRHERDEVLDILRAVDSVAASAHEATFHRRDPAVDTFLRNIYDILSVYGDPVVAASATKRDVVPQRLLNGRHETLYLFAPEHDQVRFQPLFTTIVRQVLAAVNDQYARTGRPVRPRLLIMLEGTSSIAAIRAVSQMASTGIAKGAEMVTVFDESSWGAELTTRYSTGEKTTNVLRENHTARLIVGGPWKEPALADDVAATPGMAADLHVGEAALLYESRPPIRIQLRRWEDSHRLQPRVESPSTAVKKDATARLSRDTTEPFTQDTSEPPEYQLIEQSTAWRFRRRKRRDIDAADTALRQRRGVNVFARATQDEPEPDDLVGEASRVARRAYRPAQRSPD